MNITQDNLILIYNPEEESFELKNLNTLVNISSKLLDVSFE